VIVDEKEQLGVVEDLGNEFVVNESKSVFAAAAESFLPFSLVNEPIALVPSRQ
jgi:hypothetical protein